MKSLLFILFIITINQSIAFSDSTHRIKSDFGLRTGFYFSSYSSGETFFGYLTKYKEKFEISIGPSFGRQPSFGDRLIVVNKSDEVKFNGFDLAYRFYPNGLRKGVDFYFQLDYFQKWNKLSGHKTFLNYPNFFSQTTDNFNAQIISSQIFSEAGFDFKFFDHIYIGTALGIGYNFIYRHITQETLTQFNTTEKQIDLSMIFQINVGGRF